jgi:hypothetical protein
MKVNLKGLPDKLRGVAWPSSARTLRRAVKSVNERDPHCHLLSHFQISDRKSVSTMAGPLVINQRKEWATVGPYTSASLNRNLSLFSKIMIVYSTCM